MSGSLSLPSRPGARTCSSPDEPASGVSVKASLPATGSGVGGIWLTPATAMLRFSNSPSWISRSWLPVNVLIRTTLPGLKKPPSAETTCVPFSNARPALPVWSSKSPPLATCVPAPVIGSSLINLSGIVPFAEVRTKIWPSLRTARPPTVVAKAPTVLCAPVAGLIRSTRFPSVASTRPSCSIASSSGWASRPSSDSTVSPFWPSNRTRLVTGFLIEQADQLSVRPDREVIQGNPVLDERELDGGLRAGGAVDLDDPAVLVGGEEVAVGCGGHLVSAVVDSEGGGAAADPGGRVDLVDPAAVEEGPVGREQDVALLDDRDGRARRPGR